ncbi:MAG: pseudouridine-5'-phosphate glycosidase [Saprospiraceae bacterium]|nr:pseudouridine-5'-phosphate glycosidase [Saprospiraceae bacterium]
MKNQYIELSKEIADAIATKLPLIALESTIISHGMPYPQNVETALLVEKTVRENGAIPATIAILGGKLKVGLNPDEIDYLGKKGQAVLKCSRRDLPFAVTNGLDGATTVASTMIIAAMAGIKIFATGGIGGVHRGASETFDISADLQELARTNVAVVCAGAKSILDLSLTLEYLETHGVPVVGWQTNEFPAFYTRSSGLLVDYRVDSVQDLAKTLQTKWELGLQGGVVIANPIPAEFSFPKERIDMIIEQALAEANQKNIKGKEVTPFLLAKIEQLTSGSSLQSNIQLVLNNAKLAAQLSKAM